MKDSNLQLSVSKTAASANFANWAWWGWMDLNPLCPKTNRFTVCRTSPSVPHPHVRGSISFGLGGWIRTSGLLLPRQAVYRTDNTPRGYGWRKIKGCVHNVPNYIHDGSGGWICTSDLRVMSLSRYYFSTPLKGCWRPLIRLV